MVHIMGRFFYINKHLTNTQHLLNYVVQTLYELQHNRDALESGVYIALSFTDVQDIRITSTIFFCRFM